ncbi:MAG: hypothetical protein R3D84_03050 [Paracoccaceae bacterium]
MQLGRSILERLGFAKTSHRRLFEMRLKSMNAVWPMARNSNVAVFRNREQHRAA